MQINASLSLPLHIWMTSYSIRPIAPIWLNIAYSTYRCKMYSSLSSLSLPRRTFRGRLIYETHACFFMTCLIAFSDIGHLGCRNHKNAHLQRFAAESVEAQAEREETGDPRYFASPWSEHLKINIGDWLMFRFIALCSGRAMQRHGTYFLLYDY